MWNTEIFKCKIQILINQLNHSYTANLHQLLALKWWSVVAKSTKTTNYLNLQLKYKGLLINWHNYLDIDT